MRRVIVVLPVASMNNSSNTIDKFPRVDFHVQDTGKQTNEWRSGERKKVKKVHPANMVSLDKTKEKKVSMR